MRVGIDTFNCDHGRSGIGSYLISLVKNLPDDGNNYDLFGSEIDRYTYDPGTGKTSFTGISISDTLLAERFWHLLSINRFAAKQKYDVILYPAGGRMLPRSFRVPGVAVINDIPSRTYGAYENSSLDSSIIRRLRRVTKVIAASTFICKDLLKLNIDPKKIVVIHNGIDHSLFYPRDRQDMDTVLIKPFSIKRPYIIYASRIHYPGKKHVELIRAFTIFKKKTGLPHRLVLAGSDGRNAEIVHREAMTSPVSSDIFLTGYFPHQNLPELYSCADACIFPSVTEGVGLPVIEAMATGIPVACARAGALPEIAGNNALYFNADEPEEIASVMETILTDTAVREKLIHDGLRWTKRFSWQKTAAGTVQVLAAVYQEKERIESPISL
ncbi:MAG: glycosyltransferase family 4 protein [Spirochaetaceae bacterium]|nr:glycosyltransferase family 4 protein [Spirochaetaceae bacterium]